MNEPKEPVTNRKQLFERHEMFEVRRATSEQNEESCGYFSIRETADVAALNNGWFGQQGKVIPHVLWTDESGNFYELEPVSIPINEPMGEKRKTILAEVKAKLTKEEISFLMNEFKKQE